MTVPVTTRPIGAGEEQGREYLFVSVKEFEDVRQMIRVKVRARLLLSKEIIRQNEMESGPLTNIC